MWGREPGVPGHAVWNRPCPLTHNGTRWHISWARPSPGSFLRSTPHLCPGGRAVPVPQSLAASTEVSLPRCVSREARDCVSAFYPSLTPAPQSQQGHFLHSPLSATGFLLSAGIEFLRQTQNVFFFFYQTFKKIRGFFFLMIYLLI